MSDSQDTELFPSTNVLTGIVLQHRGKIVLLPFFTINRNMQNMKL